MLKVVQTIPVDQVKIILDSLSLMETTLKSIEGGSWNENLSYRLFDISVLKALLNDNEVVVQLSEHHFNSFTARNGVDFPNYTK